MNEEDQKEKEVERYILLSSVPVRMVQHTKMAVGKEISKNSVSPF